MRSASNAPARSLPAFPSPPALRSAASGPCSSASQKATESVSGRGVPFPSSSLFASQPVRIPTQDDASRGTAAGARKCGAPHGASAAGSTRRPESTLPMRACSGRAPCNHHAPSTLLPQKCPCTNSPDVPFRSCCGSSWRRVQQRRRCTGPEVAGGGGGPRMSPPSAGECAPGLMHAPQPFLRAARRRLASVLAPRPPRSPLGRRSAESRGRPPRRCAFVLLYAGGGVRVDDADAGHTHTPQLLLRLWLRNHLHARAPRGRHRRRPHGRLPPGHGHPVLFVADCGLHVRPQWGASSGRAPPGPHAGGVCRVKAMGHAAGVWGFQDGRGGCGRQRRMRAHVARAVLFPCP